MKTQLSKEWKQVELGKIFKVDSGQAAPQGEKWFTGDRVFVRAGDLNKLTDGVFVGDHCQKITKDAIEKYSLKLYPRNSVVFPKSGMSIATENIAILKYDSYVVSHLAIIETEDLVDSRYIFYFLKQYGILNLSQNDSYPSIKISDVKNMKISLPNKEIRTKIVSILENAEKIKELRKKADELTKDYLQAIFLEMFGEPLTNSKKWEIKKMKDISKKIVSGTTPKGGKEVYVENGVVFFRSQNVWKNRLSLDNVAYIDDDTHAKMIKSSLKNKDILMTKTGRINTENSSLGRAAMFLGEDNSANINGHVYLIRLQENIIPEFVLFIITTNEYREYIRSVCVGAIDKRQINKEHLENFPIIFPPVELQIKFVSILKEVEEMKEQQKQSRIQIHNLFNHLMQKAFKGEIAC